jgi:hypothetical protein
MFVIYSNFGGIAVKTIPESVEERNGNARTGND